MCFFMTKSVTLTCCAPLFLMGARYYYSRKVIQNYLDCALHTDMADIEAYYMTPTGKLQAWCVCALCVYVCVCKLSAANSPPSVSLFFFSLSF